MEAIYIPNLLKAPQKTEAMEIQDFMPNLETLTPVRGKVVVTHQRTYLEVRGQAETIVTLTCHRCLQHYNHRLEVDGTELIWLEESEIEGDFPLEQEVKLEDLAETLDPRGYFSPDAWLYEQLCLALPLRQLCQMQCQGIDSQVGADSQQIDRRWASLEVLRKAIGD
ncbi:DUF177 domain-containing protein [Lusitaniella coriacea LEGE 07157]|uniref:DUF177 domain-containing protein n=1 Tax=Lusitaniella coriacea LEGE 07157 TaxID=945747 RepID=A0A8J7ARW4_9CYAN|nr:YceD family protein [Lusitaniella coriacea]MBE9115091.1 DUF177 domain-containing protein [Lusitaniella coriacea LEGE 07157]